jgi:hypothetical protein
VRQKIDKALDKFDEFLAGFDRLWNRLDPFDEELPESTVVDTTIRVSLTRKQLMGLLLGEKKRLLFKVKDGVAIQVELKP